ncbi:tetratricopeptide repeat protein [Nitrosomonadales bacterium]|nr:tetratricopeptide repeat protein [Nitrosomonadales bacterium]
MSFKEQFQKAVNFHKKGNLKEAQNIYETILESNPNDFNCLHLLGLIAKANKDFERSVNFISKAIKINPNSSEAHFNLGNVLRELLRYEEAIDSYNQAIKIKPDYELYFVRGILFFEIKLLEKALESFDNALKLKPNSSETLNNIGLVNAELKNFKKAILNYDKAIKINQNFLIAKHNRGLALLLNKNETEALNNFKEIIKIDPDYIPSLFELAKIYRNKKYYDFSLDYCERVIKLDPNHLEAVYLGIKIRQNICNWEYFEQDILFAEKMTNQDDASIGPYASLIFYNNPLLQKKIAIKHASKNCTFKSTFEKIKKYQKHKKIRIAYFSPDFYVHPVSNLLVEIIESHDKSRFDIYGFSLIDWPDDKIKNRLKNAFTKFINLENLNSKDIVKLSRDMEIDIVIDLAVHTGQNKSDIFFMRAAPIQINYLGFPGTSGADCYDYIIADSVLIPKQAHKFYTEKVLYLDLAYPTDSKKTSIKNTFTRKDFNLPTNCFIFCCINNNYKFTPLIFDTWMRVLKKVNQSVLFLNANDEVTQNNLKKEALNRNINPTRLIFGEKLNYSHFLERLNLMDLFLDTYPFNGHSTACDVLWAGLPIVTLSGEHYASRGGASLLNAVKLNSLITHNIKDYENLAVTLANNPEKLKKMKKSLVDKKTLDLFNTKKFTQDIENGYQEIYERYQDDLPPKTII